VSFGFVLKPSKKAEQYERFPPGSFEDEQRLVLFEVCWISVLIATGPPVPPVSVGPEGVAEKDALAKRLLCVTKVDRGEFELVPVNLVVRIIFVFDNAAVTGDAAALNCVAREFASC
jgi:hypothetical protein